MTDSRLSRFCRDLRTTRTVRTAFAMLAICLAATACSSDPSVATELEAASSGQRIPTPRPATPAAVAVEQNQQVAPEESSAGTAELIPTVSAPVEPTILNAADVVADRKVVNILAEFPHREDSFTQGLLLDPEGRMFESTGSYGASTTRLMEVDRVTGEPIRSTEPTSDVWGEGLALVDDRFVQLTYRAETAFIWDGADFEKLGEFRYDTAGWGLCFDETKDRLVMSDGTSALVFRDPDTFAPLGEPLEILMDGVSLTSINELECVDGRVWANVFLTDLIVEIDPENGAVVTVVDASGLNQPRPFDSNAVLNGIAYDAATGHFLITGKFWDTLYEVEFVTP